MTGQQPQPTPSRPTPAGGAPRDRHKDRPIPFRPPAPERSWLMEHHKRTGKAVNAILTAALTAYRKHQEKDEGTKP